MELRASEDSKIVQASVEALDATMESLHVDCRLSPNQQPDPSRRRYTYVPPRSGCASDVPRQHRLVFTSAAGGLLQEAGVVVSGCVLLRFVVRSSAALLALTNLRITREECPSNTWLNKGLCVGCERCAVMCANGGGGAVRKACFGTDRGHCHDTCDAGTYSDGESCYPCPNSGFTCIAGCKRAIPGGMYCPSAWIECRDGTIQLESCGDAAHFCASEEFAVTSRPDCLHALPACLPACPIGRRCARHSHLPHCLMHVGCCSGVLRSYSAAIGGERFLVGAGNFSACVDTSGEECTPQQRSVQHVCSPGNRCVGGVQEPCPIGTYQVGYTSVVACVASPRLRHCCLCSRAVPSPRAPLVTRSILRVRSTPL